MNPTPDIQIKPVDKNNWNDFEKLFMSKGTLNNCWCMAWRMTNEELKNNNPQDRKIFIKQRVLNETPIGLLAYERDEVIAWCSIAPRETFQRLGGDESLENVWSIVCFYIKAEFRHKGIIDILIDNAKKYARSNNAQYLEAYPVDLDSPSYRSMGYIMIFEKSGFTFVKKAGSRRHVMIHKL